MAKKLIYLEDALDALAEESYHNEEDYRTAVKAIGGLPSAQPEQQMQCGGCRYDNHASGWSDHCVLCRRNYLDLSRFQR